MKTSINIIKSIIYILFLFSGLVIFQISGKSFFLLLELLLIVSYFFSISKIKMDIYWPIYLYYISLVLTTAVSMLSNIPVSYKKSSFHNCWVMFVMLFVICCIHTYAVNNRSIFKTIKSAIQIMCVLHLFWCIFQTFLYKMFYFDINTVLFTRIFHFVDMAAAYKNNQLYPSGLSWHPGILAPIVVLSFYLFDNIWIKILAIVVAFLSKNTTCQIGVLVCLGFECIHYVKTGKVVKKKITIILFLIGLCFVATIFTRRNNIVFSSLYTIVQKITGEIDSSSANAHKMYFTEYPKVIANSNILQIIFGYGKGCSGYIFTKLFSFHTGVKSWGVECDIMNTLISNGIFGFCIYYAILIYIIQKGRILNKKYALIMVALILEGVTYQVQYDWVFLIEIIFLQAIQLQYDFFESKEKEVL